ncbi:copper resistance protein CopC [Candidatus Acetothermia bacterium]|nr:copper resistance protein CopC [Candidatus Acetothermia bacterium]MBI3461275.1 copper resistance protein CopC [Candidatus Acetothermia bacterium]MBI3660575.1 copper resistance protein CopC [Candidatus Acetothermia bacterium]
MFKLSNRNKALAIFAVIGGIALWMAVLVFAHPKVTSSNIAPGAVLAAADVPGSIQVQFSEDIDNKRSTIYVYKMGPDNVVDLGDVRVNQDTLSVSLRPSLSAGVYQVRWIAISPDDGGYREGTINFAIK